MNAKLLSPRRFTVYVFTVYMFAGGGSDGFQIRHAHNISRLSVQCVMLIWETLRQPLELQLSMFG